MDKETRFWNLVVLLLMIAIMATCLALCYYGFV